VALTTHPI